MGQRVDFVCQGGIVTFALGGGASWDVAPTPSAVSRAVGFGGLRGEDVGYRLDVDGRPGLTCRPRWGSSPRTDRVTGGGPVDPSTLTALAAWFDAADPAVFTYGTSPQVASWVDKSS